MKKYLYFFPIVLCIITLIAGFLRTYKLSEYPTGFHIDEASLGYNGYSLLKTGKDEHGIRFPLYIDMFGDNRPSGYHYLTILPIAVFGLTEFATRFPGAVFGTLSVIVLYFLVKELFSNRHKTMSPLRPRSEASREQITKNEELTKNQELGTRNLPLLSALLLAISPWHVVSSRASAESIVSLFFILLGTTCVLRAMNTKKIRFLIMGSMCMIFSFLFYHTSRVFVPLLLLGIAALELKNFSMYSRKFRIASITNFFVIGLISFLLVFVVKGGTGRFLQVSIFGFPETRLIQEEQIREDGVRMVSPFISRMYHNKIISFALTFTSNYLDYFSGQFLFLSGGRPLWYKVPNMGMIYLVELPFIIIGCIYLCTQKSISSKIPLMWILIAPLVPSITIDDIPNVQRVMVMFPMIEILAGVGMIRTWIYFQGVKARVVVVLMSIALFFNVTYFIHQYTVHGSAHETLYRFNGFKEMIQAVKVEYDQYDTIIMTKSLGGIYPHVLFFMNYDPLTYQKEGSPKDPNLGGFGKFIFAPQECPSINGDDSFPKTGRILFVNSGVCKVSPLEKQKKIYREDGSLAFIILYPGHQN